jgi:DNA-binding transcriptional LysR family regulator
MAIMPRYVVQAEVEQSLLHTIPVEGKPFTRSLKLIWDANMHFSPIANAFLAELSPRYQALKPLVKQINE